MSSILRFLLMLITAFLLVLVFAGGCAADPAIPTAEVKPPSAPLQPSTIPSIVPTSSQDAAGNLQRMTITGKVISGGDTTPAGLLDAPRKFVYIIQSDSGAQYQVTYTAYPPGPLPRPKPALNFQSGSIEIGDILTATGVFDPQTKTLTVGENSDSIETSRKP